jgi:hypothetical protein
MRQYQNDLESQQAHFTHRPSSKTEGTRESSVAPKKETTATTTHSPTSSSSPLSHDTFPTASFPTTIIIFAKHIAITYQLHGQGAPRILKPPCSNVPPQNQYPVPLLTTPPYQQPRCAAHSLRKTTFRKNQIRRHHT